MYYIQRAKFSPEKKENRKGIDQILDFDYMGSAEFEFGALGKSLKEIRGDFKDYDFFQYSFNDAPSKVISIFCKEEESENIIKLIQELADGDIHRTKEGTQLKDWVYPAKVIHPYSRADFWWDIDNHFMFWKFDPSFEMKFKEVINQ